MPGSPLLPADHVLVRTTPEFNEESVPPALLATHATAVGVWGNLVVLEGRATFVFEDEADAPYLLGPTDTVAIAPQRPHRVVITGPVRFVVEFYRHRSDVVVATPSTPDQ